MQIITFSHWLKIIGGATMIAGALWSFTRARTAGQGKRMLILIGGQQLSFAIVFLAWFIPWEPAEIATTFAALAISIWLSFRVLTEQQALNAQIRAQVADVMREIDQAKPHGS